MTKNFTAEDTVQKGKEIYQRDIQGVVEGEPSNYGKILVLDVKTEQYEIAADAWQAVDKLRERLPDAEPFVVRIGFPTVFRIGAGAYRA